MTQSGAVSAHLASYLTDTRMAGSLQVGEYDWTRRWGKALSLG